MFCWDPFLVGKVGSDFSRVTGEKLFSVGLVNQLFQPVPNQVKTVERHLSDYAHVFTRDVYL